MRQFRIKSKEDLLSNVDLLNNPSDVPILMEIFTDDEKEKIAYQSIMKANDYRTFADKVANRLKSKLKKII